MLASQNILFLGLLLSAAAMARGADPEPKEPTDTLETARRDLQELRTLERSQTPSRRLPESTLQLPLVLPSSSTGKVGEGSATTAPEPSQGWLLDALKKTEAQDRARSTTSRGEDRLSPEAARRKAQGAPNPFSNYLQQWLSPQDRRLLGGEKLNPTALERAGIHEDEPFRAKPINQATPLLSRLPDRKSALEERANPYLTPAQRDENFLPEPLALLPSDRAAQTPLSRLSNSPLETPTYSPPWDTAPSSVAPTKPEALPPPTTPLLDERRYFPQLRRF